MVVVGGGCMGFFFKKGGGRRVAVLQSSVPLPPVVSRQSVGTGHIQEGFPLHLKELRLALAPTSITRYGSLQNCRRLTAFFKKRGKIPF